MTSQAISIHGPCPCGKSSDAYALYDDGHGHCFSCGKTHFKTDRGNTIIEDTDYTLQYVSWRGISAETMRKYGCLSRIDTNGKPHSLLLRYPPEGTHKVRYFDRKDFRAEGKMTEASLFGMDVFSAGSAKAITITEGELDAMSLHQITGGPVVSIRGASSAKTDCLKAFAYLDSFEKIYLAFDNDEAGEKACAQVAPLFDFNKIYHVKFSKYKDANEYLEAGASEELKRIWWNSKRFLPEGVHSTFAEFKDIIGKDRRKPTFEVPFKTLQEMTFGLFSGEVFLITALEGVGKTEIIRAMEYKLLKETDVNIGTLHLEEDKARQLKGLAGLELKTPVHLPTSNVSQDEIVKALEGVVKKDDRLHLYSHFGSDDPDVILQMIRFLVAHCGCRVVFLDHITMVVTGLFGEDERRALDYISTRLAMMVKELDFCLVMVSHVNDDDKTRGSRNISKIAGTWVHLSRDLESPSESDRNTTSLILKKNRLGARTGFAGDLYFDEETFILADKDTHPAIVGRVNPELPT